MLFIGGSWINDFAKSFAEFLESTIESEHLIGYYNGKPIYIKNIFYY